MHRVSRTRRLIEDSLAEAMWRKCRADKAYFFSHLMIPSVRDPRGREQWELFDYQLDDQRILDTQNKVVVLKARQLGLSTLVAGNVMHDALFRPGSVSLWVSNNQDNANKAIAMIDTIWRFMPAWMAERAPVMTKDQAGSKEWTFNDGSKSRIRAYAGTGTAGASETATKVILDEFALVDDQANLYRTVAPTVDAGLEAGLSALWIISTARGGANLFAKFFNQAVDGRNSFDWIFHPWMESRFVNPKAYLKEHCLNCHGTGFAPKGQDGKYCSICVDTDTYNAKVSDLSDQPWLVPAEYPSDPAEAFRESGRPRFSFLPNESELETGWVRGHVELGFRGIGFVFNEDTKSAMRIRQDFVEDGVPDWRKFVLYADPARGEGGDAYAAHVVGFDEHGTPEIVAWWHHNLIEQSEAAKQMGMLGRYFNEALLVVERTGGYGDTSIRVLRDEEKYPNMYIHRPPNTRTRRIGTQVGFPVHRHNRTPMIDLLATHVTTKNNGPILEGMYRKLRRELTTFVRHENGQVAADVGAHDDLVMSIAGALTVLVNEYSATQPPKEEKPKAVVSENRVDVEKIYKAVATHEARQEAKERKHMVRQVRRQRAQKARVERRGRIR